MYVSVVFVRWPQTQRQSGLSADVVNKGFVYSSWKISGKRAVPACRIGGAVKMKTRLNIGQGYDSHKGEVFPFER
jgi:hypothetical protein